MTYEPITTSSRIQTAALRALYRALAPRLLDDGMRIHAFGYYATDRRAMETLVDLGFGKIVIDAAAPARDLHDAPERPTRRTWSG